MNICKEKHNELKQQIIDMLKKDWTGKKGLWTDSSMFKYTNFYTGNKKSVKKVA